MKYLLIIISISLHLLLASDDITITNKAGVALKVKLIQLKDNKIRFKSLSNFNVYEVELSSLDKASNTAIKSWVNNGGGLSKKFKIEFVKGRKQKLAKNGDYDDKSLTLEPRVIIKNEDISLPTPKVDVLVVMLGVDVKDRNKLKVFIQKEVTIDSIEAYTEKEVQLKEVTFLYDDNDAAQYGYKYYGYGAIVHRDKEIITSKILPSPLQKHAHLMFDLKQNVVFDKDFEDFE